MRKLNLITMCVSIIGVTLSFFFLLAYHTSIQGLIPSWIPPMMYNFIDSSHSYSPYSSILSIPVSVIYLFYFLWVFMVSLVSYVSVLKQVALIYAAVIMGALISGADCVLLVVTAVDDSLFAGRIVVFILLILVFGIFILESRIASSSASDIMKKVARMKSVLQKPQQKFSAVMTVCASVFLLSAVYFGNLALEYRAQRIKAVDESIRIRVRSLLERKPERARFHRSLSVTGDAVKARVRIAIFSDPFCPACIAMFKKEERIVANFSAAGAAVSFEYYLFPLDRKCNPAVKHEIHRNSCEASGYIYAASRKGMFNHFMRRHAGKLSYLSAKYDAKHNADSILAEYFPKEMVHEYAVLASGRDARRYIARDIALAQKLGIRRTPAVFINGIRCEGDLSEEFLTSAISAFLSKVE
jgi:predicted DsbA family dithiol-disulfide isomerase